jgi:hypothetical protein
MGVPGALSREPKVRKAVKGELRVLLFVGNGGNWEKARRVAQMSG